MGTDMKEKMEKLEMDMIAEIKAERAKKQQGHGGGQHLLNKDDPIDNNRNDKGFGTQRYNRYSDSSNSSSSLSDGRSKSVFGVNSVKSKSTDSAESIEEIPHHTKDY